MGSIYKITNTRNSKAYIGQTNRNIEERVLREHLAGKGKGSRLVKRAVKKYGKDAFAYEILHDGIIPEFLDDLEIEAIEKFNTIVPYGYNLTTGGEGGFHSVEACRKMSESRKGKKLSQSHRRNISEGSKGRVCSEKTRRKLSEANAGKKHSDETLRKLKDKKVSEETRRKMAEAKTQVKNILRRQNKECPKYTKVKTVTPNIQTLMIFISLFLLKWSCSKKGSDFASIFL